VDFDAVVLAGGRSRRLGGIDKRQLQVGGRSLLQLACEAVGAATDIVAVGPGDLPTPAGVRWVHEQPPGGGPAAALGAALDALARSSRQLVLVLACDVPRSGEALPSLLAAASAGGADGWVAVDEDGRRQTLLAVYTRRTLHRRLQALAPLDGTALRVVLDGLDLAEVQVPPAATRDIDTWDDAQELGARRP